MGDQPPPQMGVVWLYITSLVVSTAGCVEELLAIKLQVQMLFEGLVTIIVIWMVLLSLMEHNSTTFGAMLLV